MSEPFGESHNKNPIGFFYFCNESTLRPTHCLTFINVDIHNLFTRYTIVASVAINIETILNISFALHVVSRDYLLQNKQSFSIETNVD